MPETLSFKCPRCGTKCEIDPKEYAKFAVEMIKELKRLGMKTPQRHGAVYHFLMFIIDLVGTEELDKIFGVHHA